MLLRTGKWLHGTLAVLIGLANATAVEAHGGTYGDPPALPLPHGGGGYRGPAGAVPPDSREPTDPPPPLDPPPPPADPRDDVPPFVTNGLAALTTYASVEQVWWSVHRAELAPVPSQASEEQADETCRALRSWASRTGDHPRSVDLTRLVLARLGTPGIVEDVLGVLRAPPEDETPEESRKAALLALGELPDPEGVHLAVLIDELSSGDGRTSGTRAFAAIALALHADRHGPDPIASAALLERFATLWENDELRRGCALALGWGVDAPGLPVLTSMVVDGRVRPGESRRLDGRDLALLLTATARASERLADGVQAVRVLKFAHTALDHPETSPELRRAALFALARLGPAGDPNGAFGVQTDLGSVVRDEANRHATRVSATLAIADVAGRSASPDAREHAVGVLRSLLSGGSSPRYQASPSIVLALGAIGRAAAPGPLETAPAGVVEPLRRVVETTSDARRLAAAAHALGLCRDKPSFARLTEIVRNAEAYHNEARAGAATGLGLLGDPAAAPFLRAALISPAGDVATGSLAASAARALRRLGDREASARIVEKLAGERGPVEIDTRDRLCLLLGLLGSPDALGPLTDLATASSGEVRDGTRFAAVRAIGRILAPQRPGALERLLGPLDPTQESPALTGILRWGR